MGQSDQAADNQTDATKEDAWFPVCLQGCCLVDERRDWCAQGGCAKMLSLEIDCQRKNRGAVVAAAFSLLVRRVTDGRLACLTPLQPTTG